MQAKKRYLLVTATLAFLGVLVLFSTRTQNGQYGNSAEFRSSYLDTEDLKYEEDPLQLSPRVRRDTNSRNYKVSECRMETCFDYSRCQRGFKVYVYPEEEKVSSKYAEILTAIRNSRYYTTDPTEACIFVLSIDTLDRDTLSTEFVKNVQAKLEKLEHWRDGQNHIIFNLYSGTWPDYNENDLGFNVGKSILAKASISEVNYRHGFDISFPLFHKEHAIKAGSNGNLQGNNVPPTRKYTLVFKGKRYLAGIGSETRNSLYHIHNDEDIILLTTCKHGRDWKKMEDERCEKDNKDYER